MVIVVLLVVGAVLAWAVARRRRKVVLAGLTAVRPVFQVAPPTRTVGDRLREERF